MSRVLDEAARAHKRGAMPSPAFLQSLSEPELRLMTDAMTTLKFEAGAIPEHMRARAAALDAGVVLWDNDELLAQHTRMLQHQLAEEARAARGTKAFMTRQPGVDAVAAAHVCLTPVDALAPVTVGALAKGVNRGTRMKLTVIAPACRIVSIALLCQDSTGRSVVLACYNFLDDGARTADAQRLFPVGTTLIVLEPYYKVMAGGGLALRVDNPCNVITVDPPVPPALAAATSPEQFKDAGNARFAAQEWARAADAYSRGLQRTGDADTAAAGESVTVTLLSNRAAARLKLRDFAGALADTDSALALAPRHAKAAFRRGHALLGLHRFASAATFMSSFLAGAGDGDVDATLPKLLATARACTAQAGGAYDYRSLPFTPEQQSLECVADFIGPVEVRATRERGWGLFVTRGVKAGTLLLVEGALAFDSEAKGQVTTAVDYRSKLVSTGDMYTMTTNLIHQAASSASLRARLALLAWQRSASGGREPSARPPDMQQLREHSLPAHAAPLSAERISGIADVNTFSCLACLQASPAAREALQQSFVGHQQLPDAAPGRPRRIEADPQNALGSLVCTPSATPGDLRELADKWGKSSVAAALAEADAAGLTALHYAVLGRRPDMTKALLALGAPHAAGDVLGMRVLHYACGEYYTPESVAALLAAGADPNARTARGLTPLHAAVALDRPEAVTALLAAGADPYVPDGVDGLPPLRFSNDTEEGSRLSPRVRAAFVAAGHDDDTLSQRWRQCSGVWLVASFMNHSAAPTVARRCVGKLMVVAASRDLKAGAELTTSYGSGEMLRKWGITV